MEQHRQLVENSSRIPWPKSYRECMARDEGIYTMRGESTTEEVLVQRILQFLESVDVVKCTKYIQHLKKVIPKVIELNGEPTSYCVQFSSNSVGLPQCTGNCLRIVRFISCKSAFGSVAY